MRQLNEIQKAIDYIEDNLTEKIDYEKAAKICCSSSYNFQRIFSVISGFTLGEYIRNRRLTLAGKELATSDIKIIDISLKYGYESPDSFTKAFRNFHGILPSQAKTNGNCLKSFSRLTLNFSMKGGNIMNYKVVELPELTVTGHSKYFSGTPKEKEQQQHDFLIDGNVRFIRYALQGMANDCQTEYCIVSDIQEDKFKLSVGSIIPDFFTDNLEKHIGGYKEKLDVLKIPAHTYVKAETERGFLFMNNQSQLYKQLVEEWLPSSDYVIANAPEITVIHKFNDNKEQSYVELFIPIEKE